MSRNSPRFKWQARWTVEGSVARHECGMTVTATGRWQMPDETTSALLLKHGPHNLPPMLRRLAAEGAAVWQAHLQGLPLRHAKIPASSKT